jgi:D-alanyl-D-alanine carboxypeptidase
MVRGAAIITLAGSLVGSLGAAGLLAAPGLALAQTQNPAPEQEEDGGPVSVPLSGPGLLSAPTPVRSDPRRAHIVIDADTGRVLFEENAQAARHPASITKVMTVYLLLEAVESGAVRLDDRIPVSRRAANAAPSKLGIRAGSTISVEDAVNALMIRSANDVAVAVGEFLGGTESGFAQTMTARARDLGMTRTQFRNASGLPDQRQITTAEDLARLALAIRRDFPQYYHIFSRTEFFWEGQLITGHNRPLASVDGVDGLKTGFVRASGFNLATTATRGGRRLVVVVMGGQTGADRDQQVAQLVEAGFAELGVNRFVQAPQPTPVAGQLAELSDGLDLVSLVPDLPRTTMAMTTVRMASLSTSSRLVQAASREAPVRWTVPRQTQMAQAAPTPVPGPIAAATAVPAAVAMPAAALSSAAAPAAAADTRLAALDQPVRVSFAPTAATPPVPSGMVSPVTVTSPADAPVSTDTGSTPAPRQPDPAPVLLAQAEAGPAAAPVAAASPPSEPVVPEVNGTVRLAGLEAPVSASGPVPAEEPWPTLAAGGTGPGEEQARLALRGTGSVGSSDAAAAPTRQAEALVATREAPAENPAAPMQPVETAALADDFQIPAAPLADVPAAAAAGAAPAASSDAVMPTAPEAGASDGTSLNGTLRMADALMPGALAVEGSGTGAGAGTELAADPASTPEPGASQTVRTASLELPVVDGEPVLPVAAPSQPGNEQPEPQSGQLITQADLEAVEAARAAARAREAARLAEIELAEEAARQAREAEAAEQRRLAEQRRQDEQRRQREAEQRRLAQAETDARAARARAEREERTRQAELARARGNITVQVGALRAESQANDLLDSMRRYFPSFAEGQVSSARTSSGTWFRVRFSGLALEAATAACQRVQRSGGNCEIVPR